MTWTFCSIVLTQYHALRTQRGIFCAFTGVSVDTSVLVSLPVICLLVIYLQGTKPALCLHLKLLKQIETFLQTPKKKKMQILLSLLTNSRATLLQA